LPAGEEISSLFKWQIRRLYASLWTSGASLSLRFLFMCCLHRVPLLLTLPRKTRTILYRYISSPAKTFSSSITIDDIVSSYLIR
jgi:hypothetical protein